MNWSHRYAGRTTLMRRNAVRELLKITAQPEIISFAGGLPAAELFPLDQVQLTVEAALNRNGGQSLQYSETEGIPALRDWIAAKFSRPHCLVQRQNVIITSGGQQALDLIGRILIDPDDRVVVENPTYLALLSAWRPYGTQFVPVPSDANGLCVEALAPIFQQRPKVAYLVPNFQNPQGTTLVLERRKQLITMLQEYDIPLVEDNPYGELRYQGSDLPHLFELDASNPNGNDLDSRIIYTGTFSKVLMPGLRVGWVVAAADVVDKLVRAKQASDLHTSTLSQYIALELLNRGFLEQQLPIWLRVYKERRDAMLKALAEYFPRNVTWTHPEGGMFLLTTLPSHINTNRLLSLALQQRVAFVPGEEFHLNGAGQNTMRLNFSNTTPTKIMEGIQRLAGVMAQAI